MRRDFVTATTKGSKTIRFWYEGVVVGVGGDMYQRMMEKKKERKKERKREKEREGERERIDNLLFFFLMVYCSFTFKFSIPIPNPK